MIDFKHFPLFIICCILFDISLQHKQPELARDYIIEQLKQTFGGRESFSRNELYSFYQRFEPDLKDTTFRWRIYNLKEKKLIRPISRSEFTLAYKPTFKPNLDDLEHKLALLLEKRFKSLKYAVWPTKVINEFMIHQPTRSFTIVEVERDAMESVFFYLKDNGIKNIFLEPEEREIDRYIKEQSNAIIMQPLVSKAPTQKIKKINTITLEKLLVDLYIERKLFNAYQGSELAIIFNNAYNRYSIDFTKLFSYAERRRKETDLIDFLTDKTDIPKTILND